MGILKKGKDFSPTEQVTSTKLDELVDNASFTNTSETSVAYTGTTGTCLQGGGLEVTSLGQLQIASSGVDNDNILDDTITSSKLSFIEDSVSTTAGKILVADGTTYDAETMSGDATIAAGGALTIATDAVTPAKTSFLGSVDTTADSTAHMLIKQSDGEYDSKNLTGDVTITQAGVTNIEDDVALGGNPTTTTQSAADNSTKIATTAYVTSGIANALTGSGGIFGTIDQTADSNPKIFSKNSSGEYDSVAPSGDVSMTQAGAFTIANDAVTVAKTSFLGTVDTTDDSTTRILSKQSDGEYDSVTPSGDVTMAQDGAFTIQADAVEGTMLNSNTVDDSTIELSSNTLSIKDDGVTTAKILNSNVTKAKIEDVANMKVLGNTSGSATAPQEVTINDTANMSDASATTLATSESIKAYVDDNATKETVLVFNATTPITIADWDSGANGTQCTLTFEHLSESALSNPDVNATDINDAGVTLSANEFTLTEGTYDISVDASITMNTFGSSVPGLSVIGFLKRKSDDNKILISNVLNHSDSENINMTLHSFIKGRIVVPNSPSSNTNVFDLRFVAQNSGSALIGQEAPVEFEAFNPNHVTVVIRKVKS